MTTATLDRYHGRAYSYDVVAEGFNYRLDEIRAALLRVQLRRLPVFLTPPPAVSPLRSAPPGNAGAAALLERPHVGEYENTAMHIVSVLLPEGTDRLAVMGRLKEAGIQTSIHYRPVHLFTAYRPEGQSLPELSAGPALLTLPLYPDMSEEDVDTVVSTLLSACAAEDDR